jgi:3-deoxy-D-manno-octulosonate 8-phosphate phosphatase (KDO 8-P phosphatase)
MPALDPTALAERARKIKLMAFDIDGVLTDGRIVLGNYGDELKFFNIQDGHGFVMLNRSGFKTVFITGRKSRVNTRRAKELKVTKVYQNAHDKLKIFEKVVRKFKIAPEEICYIGDDLIDIPLIKRGGLGVAVANAVPETREAAHYVTTRKGGKGAAREVIDMVLKAQAKWTEVTQRYYR